jgi:hypothetical protein
MIDAPEAFHLGDAVYPSKKPRLVGTPSAVVMALAGWLAPDAAAQVRASERGTVSQVVDGTTITVEYSRPVTRGRPLFGETGVVRWGHAWTPGANWATTIEVDRDVRINGQPLPKGRYSVWVVPNPDAWAVMLSRTARVFHTRPPDDSSAQVRVVARTEQGAHMDALAWYFPNIAPGGTTLRFHWGTTVMPLNITVQPTRPTALTAADRARYVGTYSMVSELRGFSAPRALEVVEEGGRLRGRLAGGLFGNDPDFDLVPADAHRFSPGWYRQGRFFDVETDMLFIFTVAEGRASAVEFRGVAEDLVFARGTRVR